MAPKKAVVNCTTGITEYIDLTPEEIAKRQADSIQAAVRKAKEKAKEDAIKALKDKYKAIDIRKMKIDELAEFVYLWMLETGKCDEDGIII